MLRLRVTTAEDFDESTNKFVTATTDVLELEHSLLALSKWESIHEVPFLAEKEMTEEQVLDYVRCMYLGDEFPEEILPKFSRGNFDEINAYIGAKMTATTFHDEPSKGPKQVVTAEIIYYWMVALSIPFECQTWHLNRLFALIKVTNLKNAPPKKMSAAAAAQERRRLNDERRRTMGTSG